MHDHSSAVHPQLNDLLQTLRIQYCIPVLGIILVMITFAVLVFVLFGTGCAKFRRSTVNRTSVIKRDCT